MTFDNIYTGLGLFSGLTGFHGKALESLTTLAVWVIFRAMG